ncbi:Uncharacterised protein [Klebsiella pneumoniae]|nr:Uncharacterised protein [Klebsiella pneumoniae]
MWRPISSFSIKNFFSRALTQYQLFFETVSKLFARYIKAITIKKIVLIKAQRHVIA